RPDAAAAELDVRREVLVGAVAVRVHGRRVRRGVEEEEAGLAIDGVLERRGRARSEQLVCPGSGTVRPVVVDVLSACLGDTLPEGIVELRAQGARYVLEDVAVIVRSSGRSAELVRRIGDVEWGRLARRCAAT